MRSKWVLLFLLISTPLLCRAVEHAIKHGEVDVKIYLPDGVKVYRGVLLHAMNYTWKSDDRWKVLCDQLGFIHVGQEISRKANNRPAKLRAALDVALNQIAKGSGHAELPNLPVAGVGHSAGGMCTSVMFTTPERSLTNCIDCAWILDPAKISPEAAAVPALFTLGAIPDGFKMLPDIESKFEPARTKKLTWGLGVQWGCAHDPGNFGTLAAAWIQAIAKMRIPNDADFASGPTPLRAIAESDGWLGDRSTTSGHYAIVARQVEFKGDSAKASWFPDRATALVWRAFQSKNPPVLLKATAGTQSLPTWDPKKSYGMMVEQNSDIVLSVEVSKGIAVRSIKFFNGDALIGEGTGEIFALEWKGAPAGAHPVWAEWQDSQGNFGVTNPALITKRFPRAASATTNPQQ